MQILKRPIAIEVSTVSRQTRSQNSTNPHISAVNYKILCEHTQKNI